MAVSITQVRADEAGHRCSIRLEELSGLAKDHREAGPSSGLCLGAGRRWAGSVRLPPEEFIARGNLYATPAESRSQEKAVESELWLIAIQNDIRVGVRQGGRETVVGGAA